MHGIFWVVLLVVPASTLKTCVETETFVLAYLNAEQLRIQLLFAANTLWFNNFDDAKLWMLDEISTSMDTLKADLQTVSFICYMC